MSGQNNILLSYGAAAASNGLLTDLQSYWKLDESSGTLADSHGSNHGTAFNSPTYSATGKINTCLDFEASSSQYVSVGTGLDFYNRSGITISAWINVESFPSSGISQIFGNGTVSTNNQIFLDLRNNSGTQEIRFGTWNSTTFSKYMYYNHSLSTGVWYHVVARHNGSVWTMYINGVSYKTGGIDGAVYNNSSTSFIGSITHTTPVRFFDGLIDEVGVWFRELSAADVALLYNSGAGLSYSSFTS